MSSIENYKVPPFPNFLGTGDFVIYVLVWTPNVMFTTMFMDAIPDRQAAMRPSIDV